MSPHTNHTVSAKRSTEEAAGILLTNNVCASLPHRRWDHVRKQCDHVLFQSYGFIIFLRTPGILNLWRIYLEINLSLCRDNPGAVLVRAHLFRPGLDFQSEGRCYALLFFLSSSVSDLIGAQ